jgi:aspartyl-tRNA(Asn)/glutamyl-tRNA(Gln) amidotransferase subunit A
VCSRYGLVAFASSLDTPGVFGQTAADCAMLLTAMAGHDARDSTSLDRPREDYVRDIDAAATSKPLAGLRIGLPREYAGEGTDVAVAQAIETALVEFRRLGAVTVGVSLPNVHLSVPVYYVIAPAEASSNLSRFDGVRYGHRAASYSDLDDMYCKTRAEGFGAEVKRRILLGTYVLSAGYYDAYYRKAQRVRTLIKRDFDEAFAKVDAIAVPTAPTPAFKLGEKIDDPLAMYLADVYTLPASLAGIAGLSVPCAPTPARADRPALPVGLQLLSPAFEEERLFTLAGAVERLVKA